MSRELLKAMKLYRANTNELNRALVSAGGMENLTEKFMDKPLEEFLANLAINNIQISAFVNTDKPEAR